MCVEVKVAVNTSPIWISTCKNKCCDTTLIFSGLYESLNLLLGKSCTCQVRNLTIFCPKICLARIFIVYNRLINPRGSSGVKTFYSVSVMRRNKEYYTIACQVFRAVVCN